MTKPVRMLNKYHIKEMLLHGNPQYKNFYKEELIQFCKIAQEELKKSKSNQEKSVELVKSLIVFWKKYTPDNSLEIGQLENLLNILEGGDE